MPFLTLPFKWMRGWLPDSDYVVISDTADLGEVTVLPGQGIIWLNQNMDDPDGSEAIAIEAVENTGPWTDLFIGPSAATCWTIYNNCYG